MKYRNKLNIFFLAAIAFIFSVSATHDATDLGAARHTATSPCTGGEEVVYRYIARTTGAKARIDEHCHGKDYTDVFVNQPTDEMLGTCTPEFCSHTTTSRRAPIEHALFQAIASLERRSGLRIKSMDKRYRESSAGMSSGISRSIASFHLDAGIECATELMVYNENNSTGIGHGGDTIANGVIWAEQKRSNNIYKLLIMVELEYDSYHESDFLREIISCQSTAGPIAAKQLSTFGFKVSRENLYEWLVSAYRTQ